MLGQTAKLPLQRPVATCCRFTLDVEDIQEGEPLVFAFMVENQLMRPNF